VACGNGYACAGTLSRPEELACCMCFWNDTKTGNRPFVSRGPGMLMGVAATCRNKARACGIAILLGLGVLWCCCCIFQSGDTGGNSQGMAGMDGRSQTTPTTEHARKKKCWQGLGSSLRKLFSLGSGRCYIRFLVDRIVLASDGLADVGRETSSLLGLPCPASLRLECSPV
jgi:hypothetical protein